MRLHCTTINNNRLLVASRHFSSRSGGILGGMQTSSDIQKGDWMSNDGSECLFYRWNLLVILEWWKNHWKGTTDYKWLPSEKRSRIINGHCFCWLNQLLFFFSVRAAARGRLTPKALITMRVIPEENETSVNNNSPFQDFSHLAIRFHESKCAPGFKLFSIIQ